MRSVYLLARNVVRENMRRRIVYVLVMFAVVLMATIELLSRFESDLQVKMVRDFGYTIMSLFGLAITILVTFDQLPQEIDSKTIYLVLTRPITRQTLIAGKFAGILTVISGFLVLLAVVLVAMTAMLAHEQKILLDTQLFQAVFLLGVKYAVFAALLMAFTLAFSRPVAVSLALLAHFFSHISEASELVLAQSKAWLAGWVFWLFQLVLPNYSMFDVSSALVEGQVYSYSSLAVITVYGFMFGVLYLLFATWLLGKKDL